MNCDKKNWDGTMWLNTVKRRDFVVVVMNFRVQYKMIFLLNS
jgi:hypothetical protein